VKKPKYAKHISKNEVLDTYAYKHIINEKSLDLYAYKHIVEIIACPPLLHTPLSTFKYDASMTQC
jgi:hypothetical protein